MYPLDLIFLGSRMQTVQLSLSTAAEKQLIS